MTTATETWHGMPSGYRARGCRCDRCTAAHAARQAYWYRLHGYGTWHPFVDAEPVRQHINTLREYGIGWKQVATLAGVARSIIQKTVYSHQGRPPQRRLREDVARKILAVKPSFDHLADSALVPATGTVRRLQALVAASWPAANLAAELGIKRTYVDLLLREGKTRVAVTTVRAVAELYTRLADVDPSTAGVDIHSKRRAQNRARGHNWAPPIAWDDDTIDDPAAEPNYGHDLKFLERAALRREEIIHFAWHGDTPEQILNRLDGEVSISTVRQIVQEWRTGQKRDRKAAA